MSRRACTTWLICGLVLGCGPGDDAPRDGRPSAGPPAEGATADCSPFSEELLTRVGIGYQMVKQIDPETNLESMEEAMALPDPETFREFGAAYADLEVGGIDPLQFELPAVVGPDQLRLADLLEAALAARDDPSNPAWSDLETFVEERAARQQVSISYFLSEVGCR